MHINAFIYDINKVFLFWAHSPGTTLAESYIFAVVGLVN